MGNCAIDRTAYIGGLLLLLQVFFEIFHSNTSEIHGSGSTLVQSRLPRGEIE
jgi:hypothetical protein